MKTLQQIAERSDYKKASQSLRNAVKEIAGIICSKMLELDFDERDEFISTNGNKYRLVNKKSNSGFNEYFLYADSGALDIKNSFYYAGDYNCFVEIADNDDFVKFANNLQDILKILDDTETELTTQTSNKTFWDFYKKYNSTEK